jgi:hypothetical protein
LGKIAFGRLPRNAYQTMVSFMNIDEVKGVLDLQA